jgi:hypothetical protein
MGEALAHMGKIINAYKILVGKPEIGRDHLQIKGQMKRQH